MPERSPGRARLLPTLAALPLLAAVAASSACQTTTTRGPSSDSSSSASADAATAASPSGTSAEGIEIELRKMLPVATRGGMELVYVWLTARNVSAAPFGVSALALKLVTTEALLVTPDLEESLKLARACQRGAEIDVGGELSCVVAFRATLGTASELAYRLPSGASRRVPLPPRDCNVLPQRGADVAARQQATLPRIVDSGGTTDVPDGDFVLTATTTRMPSPSGASATTIRIKNGRFELVVSEGAEARVRATGNVTTSGAALTLRSDCHWQDDTGRGDSVDDSESPTLLVANEHRYFAQRRALVIVTSATFSEYSLAE